MSVNRRRRDNAIEIQESSTMFDIIEGTLSPDPETVENHTRQIEYLQKEIEERDKTLSRLKQDFNDLLAQNDDLQITLESKNHEVEALKDKGSPKFDRPKQELKVSLKASDKERNELKDTIRQLQNKLKSLELSTEDLNKRSEDAKEERKKIEEDNNKLKLAIEKQSKKIERMTKERVQKEEEDYKWKKQWQPKMQLLESHGRRGGLPLADPVEKAYIVLGEMCSQLQAMMYQKVLPDSYYKEYTRYKVKSIEREIDRKHGDVQRQAIERWDNLKKELSWDEINHPSTLKEIQSERNIVAHPGVLTKESLLQSENVMQEAREKCGRMRLTHVREIIEMWDHLTQMK
nr:centrosomal protein of 70 kDa-like [Pocillopora verrucosa]